MTSISAPLPAPETGHRGRWLKAAVGLLLLALLAWVSVIAVQYFQTGRSIGSISAIPKPLAKLVYEAPIFDRELDGIMAPVGVAFGPDGAFYATESEGEHLVRAFDANGKATATFTTPASPQGLRVPVYVAVSPANEVYVTDRAANAIYRFSRSGELLGAVPGPQGWHPLGIAFDSAGNLYVTDVTENNHRILILDQQFQLKSELLAGQLNYPNSLAVDKQGRIWVADSNNGRVLAVTESGSTSGKISAGDAAAELGLPRGVAIDNSRDWLFVSDTTGHSVNIYDIRGASPKFQASLGTEQQPAAGGFAYPNGIAFDGNGRLIIADRASNRLLMFRY